MSRADLRRYLRRVASVAAEQPDRVGPALVTVAHLVAEANGIDLAGADLRLLHRGEPLDDARLRPPTELVAPELIGQARAALMSGAARRRRGAFMTPASIAEPIVEATLAPLLSGAAPRVCDPAVGGGAFLLAAARRLAAVGTGTPLPEVVGRLVHGSDVDPLAVDVAEAALAILGWDGGPPPGLASHLVVGDPLLERDLLPGPFDAVVANPPFLNQLERATARSRATAAALVDRFGEAARGYADGAAVFFLLGLELTRPGGRVGMILPDSVLAARDAGPVRRAVARAASIEWVWADGGSRPFDAGVAVCAVVAERGSPQRAVVERAAGPTFTPLAAVAGADLADGSWAAMAALDVPAAGIEDHGCIGDRCRVTADFRDQFYGLAPLVGEDDGTGGTPVITCGLIDPALSRWGVRSMRIGGRRFERPVVDVDRLERETSLGPWARQRFVPKVLVATQTRVIEAAVDIAGAWLPSTPVITVEVDPERAWHVAAALMAPPVSALALRATAGTALAPDAIKLTAKQVAALPLPAEGKAWDEGAAAIRRAASACNDEQAWRAAMREAGAAMCRAYAVTNAAELIAWWSARLPRWTISPNYPGKSSI